MFFLLYFLFIYIVEIICIEKHQGPTLKRFKRKAMLWPDNPTVLPNPPHIPKDDNVGNYYVVSNEQVQNNQTQTRLNVGNSVKLQEKFLSIPPQIYPSSDNYGNPLQDMKVEKFLKSLPQISPSRNLQLILIKKIENEQLQIQSMNRNNANGQVLFSPPMNHQKHSTNGQGQTGLLRSHQIIGNSVKSNFRNSNTGPALPNRTETRPSNGDNVDAQNDQFQTHQENSNGKTLHNHISGQLRASGGNDGELHIFQDNYNSSILPTNSNGQTVPSLPVTPYPINIKSEAQHVLRQSQSVNGNNTDNINISNSSQEQLLHGPEYDVKVTREFEVSRGIMNGVSMYDRLDKKKLAFIEKCDLFVFLTFVVVTFIIFALVYINKYE